MNSRNFKKVYLTEKNVKSRFKTLVEGCDKPLVTKVEGSSTAKCWTFFREKKLVWKFYVYPGKIFAHNFVDWIQWLVK